MQQYIFGVNLLNLIKPSKSIETKRKGVLSHNQKYFRKLKKKVSKEAKTNVDLFFLLEKKA